MRSLIINIFLALTFACAAHAQPAGAPAGNPIINSAIRQKNSVMNIDTATITTANISSFTNTPSFPVGIMVNGAIYNSLGYGAGPGKFYDVSSFGATGNGTTDDTAAIQAAASALVTSGNPGMLLIPPGHYKCTSGLTINVGFASVYGEGAVLDFSSLTSGTTAMTIIGDVNNSYFGNPYYNADKSISGITMIGPGRTTQTWAMVLRTAGEPGPSHMKFYNLSLSAWGTGFYIGDNAYINAFYGCEVWISSICFQMPAGTNSGERVYINGGAFFNSSTGILMQQAIADVYVDATSIDGMDVNYVRLEAGDLRMSKVHFEGNYCPDHCGAHVLYVPATNSNPVYAGINDSLILLKSSRTVAAIELDHTAYVSFNNNHVNNDGSNSTPVIISSIGVGGSLDTSGTVNTSNDALFVNGNGMSYYRNEAGLNITTSKTFQGPGTITNDNAGAGIPGEFISTSCSSANPVTAAISGNYYDILSVYLSSGDWNISGVSCAELNGAVMTTYSGGINTVPLNSGSGLTHGDNFQDIVPPTATADACVALPLVRASLASGTTYYLKGIASYTSGTPKSYGNLKVRRAR